MEISPSWMLCLRNREMEHYNHPKQNKTWIQTLLFRVEISSGEQHLASEKMYLEKVLEKNGYTDIDVQRATKKKSHRQELR